jgi:hypothetical protein
MKSEIRRQGSGIGIRGQEQGKNLETPMNRYAGLFFYQYAGFTG